MYRPLCGTLYAQWDWYLCVFYQVAKQRRILSIANRDALACVGCHKKLRTFSSTATFTFLFHFYEQTTSLRNLLGYGSAIHNSRRLNWQGIQVIYPVHVCYWKLYVTICQQDDERDLDSGWELNMGFTEFWVVFNGTETRILISNRELWGITILSYGDLEK